MKTIIKNVKGIKELTVEENDYNKLFSRIQGVYGANGTGKSSLKDAITGQKPTKNWDMSDQEQAIDINLKFMNNAIFDERIIDLVKYNNPTNISVFGRNITSLYELLVNRDEIIKGCELQEYILEGLLQIDVDFLDNTIIGLKKVIGYVKKIVNDNIEQEVNNDINNSLYELLVRKFNEVIHNKWGRTAVNYLNDISMFNSSGYSPHFLNFLRKVKESKDFTNEKKDAIVELEKMQSFFETLKFMTLNFGYIEYQDKFSTFFDEPFYTRSFASENSNHLAKFLEGTQTRENYVFEFKNIWNSVYQKVVKVTNLTNLLLEGYGLSYTILLAPNKNKKQTEGNLSLKHGGERGTVIDSLDIVKCVSYGEMSIISLSLFVSSLITNGIPENSTVIFDDPISSYDLSRVRMSITILKNLIISNHRIKNIWFMSHEKHFISSLTRIIYCHCKKMECTCKNFVTTWELLSNECSHLRHIEKLESDFDFYKKHLKSSDILTNLVSKRFFAEIMKEIKAIDTEGVDTKKSYNKEIYNKDNCNLFANPFEKKDRNTIISIKSWYSRKECWGSDFWNKWLIDKSKIIMQKILKFNELNNDEKDIFKVVMYRETFNLLAHSSDGDDVQMDISRSSEIVDIIYSNFDSIKNSFDVAFLLFKDENGLK